MPASRSATERLTVVVAAYDELLVNAAIEFRASMRQQRPDWDVLIVDVSQAIAPGQTAMDPRGVHRLVMDPSIRIIADPPLRSSALLAEWLDANVADDREWLLILPADGGIAHFPVAQRAQGIATRRARIGVYLASAPAIASIGNEQMLSDLRVLELAATTQKCIARSDVLLAREHAESTLAQLGWRTPYTIVHDIDAEGLFELAVRLDALPPPAIQLQSMPFVSVCITHHERPALLEQTLASIRNQSYPSFEVILVDDGSSSAEAVSMLDSLEREFAERSWKIIRQPNRYLGAARNTAVKASQGELLLFIDDDDCMRDGYIEQFVRAAEGTGADVVTCFLEYFEGMSAPTSSTRVHHRWVMPGPIGAGTLLQNTFGGANGLVSRAAYDMIGGYTEDHGVGFEDWEFYNRLLAKGARFEVLPRPLLWCRWGIGGMQATAQKQAQQKSRAVRPAREAMPHAWRELPALAQGLHERNRELLARVQKLEHQLAATRTSSAPANNVPNAPSNPAPAEVQAPSTVAANGAGGNDGSTAGNGASNWNASSTVAKHIPTELPAIVGADVLSRRRCHVWHTEGLGLSGILSWMWRLRDHFAPQMNMELRLVDLAVLPYGFQQAGADPSTFYDERVSTSQEFLTFLRRTADDVHVVNHAFPYLRSLMEQLGADVLRGLRLVGVCHTDQEYYYSNLEQLAPVLRSIIAVSPTCADTLARRIPEHAHKIVTLPAWAVKLPEVTAPIRSADEPLRLLYTGRVLHFQKRVFDLVELATRLRAAKVHATLTIAGDGPDLVELQQRFTAAAGRSIPVTFEPVRPPWEMDAILTSHHAFVQVSEFEGASVSLMEALAHALVPIVTTTRSGHELLVSDVNALTAPVGDMKRLTALIALLARDRGRQARLATAARETAEKYLEELAYPERFASLVHAVAA